ncbi:unnamed protein product [Phaeothamnion confervicola]
MFVFGLMQAWFCDIFVSERFWHILNWRRWYFFVSFFASGVVFSVLSDIPSLAGSISTGNDYTAAQIAVYGALGASGVAVILWHGGYAWHVLRGAGRHRCFTNFHVYLWSRAALLTYYGTYMWLVLRSDTAFEVHHYFIAWGVSTIAIFNNTVSLVWLGCSAGIFVQGIGAYHSSFLFYDDS